MFTAKCFAKNVMGHRFSQNWSLQRPADFSNTNEGINSQCEAFAWAFWSFFVWAGRGGGGGGGGRMGVSESESPSLAIEEGGNGV